MQVWLFGSLAGGRCHADSDVDLLVSGLPSDAWAETWAGLELLLGVSVDLVRAEEASPSLLAGARREGVDITRWGGPDVSR
jgi:predicted nucleotidyltransferase